MKTLSSEIVKENVGRMKWNIFCSRSLKLLKYFWSFPFDDFYVNQGFSFLNRFFCNTGGKTVKNYSNNISVFLKFWWILIAKILNIWRKK
jgi:hypothetical protein